MTGSTGNRMTTAERTNLCTMARQREKVAKSAASQHAAEQRAAFERELDRTYPFDSDEVWTALRIDAERLIAEAKAAVTKRAHELGIPERFQPSMGLYWNDGSGQKTKAHKADLRKLAHAHIEAAEKKARVAIERASIEIQDEILSSAISSEEGRSFLIRLPTVEALMPPVEVSTIERMLGERRATRLIPGHFTSDDA